MSDRRSTVPETSYGFRKRIGFVEREIARRFSGVPEGIAILDVGCGTGRLLAIPLAEAGFRVHGIDLDAGSVAAAEEIARRRSLANATFARCDVTSVDAGGFDVVVCSEVLEHVLDYPRFFGAVLERMKRGGLVILTVPNGRGPFELQSFVWKRWIEGGRAWALARALYHGAPARRVAAASLNRDGHVNFFTVEQLQRLFAEHELHLVSYEGRTFLAGTLFSWAGVAPVSTVNAWLGTVMPARLVSGWMFALERDAIAAAPTTGAEARLPAKA